MSHRLVLAACSSAALVLSPAWAADFPAGTSPTGAHYSNGASEPVCNLDTDSGTVSCTGTMISGVGNTDAKIVLAASASVTVQCRNHGGQIVEVKTSVQNSATDTANAEPKNGTMTVDPISVNLPTTQDLVNAAKCPNKNWDKVPLGTPEYGYTYTLTFKNFSSPAISLP